MTVRPWKMFFLFILLLLLVFPTTSGSEVAAQDEGVQVSASMNAYYYTPGEQAYLDLQLELPEHVREDAVSLDLLIYPSAITRSYLASFREGIRRSPIIRRTLETIPPEGEWTDKLLEIDLDSLGLRPGVYPHEIRVTQNGEVLSSDYNFLVIMDPGAGYPLNLSLLWTLDFLPSTDAQGNELDSGLAAACSPSPSETGFLYALAEVLKRSPGVHSSVALPPATHDDLESLAGGVDDQENGDTENGAAEVLRIFDEMFESGQVDLMATTYAFADLDLLASLGWENDAATQLELGLDGAGELGGGNKGFINPLFHLSDGVLQEMVNNDLEFTVVGEEIVQSSAAGRRLMEGTTLSRPVNFINENGFLLKAFVRDDIICDYLENTTRRDASRMVQNILAELAVLQREKPYNIRSCVLAFPPSFMPSKEFLDELYASLESCPWLQTRYLSELNADQFPIEGIALQAPVYTEPSTSYDQKLRLVRGDALALSSAIPEDNPLREELGRSILTAENYRFVDEKNVAAAQMYLDSIDALIQGETSQVNIEEKRSVTLSSTKGQLTVVVTNALYYPITATLLLKDGSVSFPDGNSMDVILEPQENRFVFSVDTRRKGSFNIDIVLETGGLVLDRTSTTVNTSIINTLAIILLACLVLIVALVIVLRRLSARLRGGKHSKGGKSR